MWFNNRYKNHVRNTTAPYILEIISRSVRLTRAQQQKGDGLQQHS